MRKLIVLASFIALSAAASPARAQDGTSFFDMPRSAPAAPPAAPPPPSAAAAPGARRQSAPRLGEAGQVVLTGSTNLYVSSASFSDSQATRDSVGGAVGVDVFVARNLSVGLDLEASVSDNKGYGADGSLVETKSTLLSGGPRIGVNVPITDRVSFYPRLTLGVHWHREDISLVSGTSASIAASPVGASSLSRTGPWLNLYAPLDVQLAPGFFLGFGPRVFHDFARAQGGPDVGAEQTRLGAYGEVGGWLGGPEAPEAPEPETGSPPAARFGDRDTIVLTSDFNVSGGSSSYSGSDASSSSITISPGVDYFVTSHVSLGIQASFTHFESVGFEPGGTRVDTSSGGFEVAPRLGVEIPLASWLSLYPRLALGFGGESFEETAGDQTNKGTDTYTWVSVSLPALVHVAQHFFVGLGPYALRQLSRTFDNGQDRNEATRIGANALVGGWL